jgi:hypothetical protein
MAGALEMWRFARGAAEERRARVVRKRAREVNNMMLFFLKKKRRLRVESGVKAVRANERRGFFKECLRSGGCDWKRSGRNERTVQDRHEAEVRSPGGGIHTRGAWTQSCTYPTSSQVGETAPPPPSSVVFGSVSRTRSADSVPYSTARRRRSRRGAVLAHRLGLHPRRWAGRGRRIGDPFG